MKRPLPWILVVCVLAALTGAGVRTLGAGAAGAPAPSPADTVYTNAIVYTADASHTMAQAVAVKNGRIVYVGDDAGAAAYVGAGTTSIDLGGKLMLPGFIDSHMHASSAISDLYEVSLYGLKSMAAYQKAIRAFAASHSALAVLQGGGWANPVAPGIGPTKQQLDAAVKDRPAVLWSEDGHSVWCNTLALKQAGITAKTKDPKGGVIERVPGTQIPSGTLREAATDPATGILPEYTVEQWKNGIRHFQEDVAAPLGLTTATDASLTPGDATLDAYQQLADADALTVRMRGFLYLGPENGPIADQVAAAVAERARHTKPLFQTNTPSSSSSTASSRATPPCSTTRTRTGPVSSACRCGQSMRPSRRPQSRLPRPASSSTITASAMPPPARRSTPSRRRRRPPAATAGGRASPTCNWSHPATSCASRSSR
jgi:predicted amidohydrolase YtcJ